METDYADTEDNDFMQVKEEIAEIVVEALSVIQSLPGQGCSTYTKAVTSFSGLRPTDIEHEAARLIIAR